MTASCGILVDKYSAVDYSWVMQRFVVTHPALNNGAELATATVRNGAFGLKPKASAIRRGFVISNRRFEIEGAALYLAAERAAVSATTDAGFIVSAI